MPTIVKRSSNPIENRTVLTPEARVEAKARLDMQMKEDLRMVKGTFKNLECPNGAVCFSVRKYKGETVSTYTMVDGGEYEVPLHVARHINNNCAYPVHKMSIDPVSGNPLTTIGKMVNRFAFISNEYR